MSPDDIPALEADSAGALVLIVEDDPSAARVLGSILRQSGYRVALAHDAPTALQMLEEGEMPDLLLLDWMLPGMSGLELCHRARQRWDPVSLPILIVTARTDPESSYAAFDAGASDYIAKPFRGVEIRARIAAHLRAKRLVDDRRRLEEHLRDREKLFSLGLLASGVAHELNNPLAVIAGHAQLLLRDGADPAETREGLREILGAVDRCRSIVGDLLGFARRKSTDRAPTDAAEVLRTTVALRDRGLRSAGVLLTLEVAPDLPPVAANSHQLQQVFLNILLNAEQALREGGRTLRLTVERAGGELRISFYNDAPPIAPHVLPRIFEPFFTTKNAEEGTGLGLPISRRIIREHGGDIEVASGAEGTTFVVRLPVDDGRSQA